MHRSRTMRKTLVRRLSFFSALPVTLGFMIAPYLAQADAGDGAILVPDQLDYFPGDVAVLTGSGFMPGELVDLTISIDDPDTSTHIADYDWTEFYANSEGGFVTTYLVPDEALNTTLTATAIGLDSGLLAASIFTDSGFFGAIFTTSIFGDVVDQNLYELRTDVYLNGGPQNNNATGLPDGVYYFQVTDPSGATLLSQDDAVCRQLEVIGGRVSNAVGPCTHALGSYNPLNGSTSVQLAPFDFSPNNGNEYKAWLIRQTSGVCFCDMNDSNACPSVDDACISDDPKVLLFSNSESKTDNFKVNETEPPPPPPKSVLQGVKWYDLDTDGIQDAGEPIIPGWRIELRFSGDPALFDVGYTATDGVYEFTVDNDGTTYDISEVAPGAGFYPLGTWFNTTSLTGQAVANNDLVEGPDFGNVCLGAGGGHTLGFWSNKNGQSLFNTNTAGNLALLVSLNLRNASGLNFDPSSYSQFKSWLLSATSTNMAYMLSAQMAAMQMNVASGIVSGSSLIYAPGMSSANAAGFASVSAVLTEANSELGLNGTAYSGDAWRSYQEALKTAIDRANNNITFVQGTPCPFDSPYQSRVISRLPLQN